MSIKEIQDYHVENAPLDANQDADIEPALEKRVVRKLDWNFVPLVVALCKYSMLRPRPDGMRQQ
jgi:hypothetical protein